MASTGQAPARARQHHAPAAATLLARTQPDGEHLGLPAWQQAQPACLGQLRGHCRLLQGGLALPHRTPGAHQFYCPSLLGMGQSLRWLVLVVPSSGNAIVTIATPPDPADADWAEASTI